MFCKHCGTKLPDDAKFCPSCGHTLTDDPHETTPPASPSPSAGAGMICCPECGSRDLQYVTDTDFSTTVKNKGYSGSKGCLGFLMFGPLGMLCGNCGSGKSTTTVDTTTSHGWICKNCGHKFRDKSEIEKEISEKEVEIGKQASKARSYSKKTSIIMAVVALLAVSAIFLLYSYALDLDSSDTLFWVFVILALASSFATYGLCSLIRTVATNRIGILKREIDELKKELARYR